MAWMLLTNGAPDEPDTRDWNAICSTPGPRQIFAALFEDLAPEGMPERTTTEVSEDETHRLHTIWLGTNVLGVKVTEVESPETTAFPMYCTWETFGLKGTKVIWKYSLEKAGQLGYSAFRNGNLKCSFDIRPIGNASVRFGSGLSARFRSSNSCSNRQRVGQTRPSCPIDIQFLLFRRTRTIHRPHRFGQSIFRESERTRV